VFNPGTENHRDAERIHGFSDSALRLQDPFAVHAADIWRFLTSYELLVAHNAAFDPRFINREMRLSGLPALTGPGATLRLMWRTGGLAPDHKTIADFRKDNGRAIAQTEPQGADLL
jgi:DNA polymerase III epsilon subunit-like protein